MFCSECGKQLNHGDKFCSVCGTRVPGQEASASYNYVSQKHNAQDVVRPQAVPTAPPVRETGRFCMGCGQKMAPQDQFCMNCGWRAGDSVQAQPVRTAAPVPPSSAQQEKKKAGKGKIWGIVLVVLQVLVLLGSMDELAGMQIFELLGFVTPGIIGVILLIRDHHKNKQ